MISTTDVLMLSTKLGVICLVLAFSIFAIFAFYNVYLHPLRSYPGPKLWAATRLVWTYYELRGELPHRVRELHERYGPVVRTAPTELSYITYDALRDIYGHRDVEMMKNLEGAGLPPPMEEGPGMANASRDDHARMRKAFSPAFSDRALREQEDFLDLYVGQFVDGLRQSSGAQNIVHWFNWVVFDIVGDLTFGEPFGCLTNHDYHPFVANIFTAIKGFAWMHLAMYLGIFRYFRAITPKHMLKAYDDTVALAREKVDRRLEKKDERKDFLSHVLRHNEDDGKGLNLAEIYCNATQIIAAGSETTGTALSGATYYLLRNPRTYSKLISEIRETFNDEANITIKNTVELEYLNAVIEEALRMYPPATSSLARIVPGVGSTIDGRFVPGGTTVGLHQYSTNHSSLNFHQPDSFLPERWLPGAAESDSAFSQDRKMAFIPFSYGPRNCIGKNLAYAELRLILARLFWNFDLELVDNGFDPNTQKAYISWEKPPLMVLVKPVIR